MRYGTTSAASSRTQTIRVAKPIPSPSPLRASVNALDALLEVHVARCARAHSVRCGAEQAFEVCGTSGEVVELVGAALALAHHGSREKAGELRGLVFKAREDVQELGGRFCAVAAVAGAD